MINILLLLGSYIFMEFVAWSNHKYVMHGFLWKWHKDHHVNDQKKQALHEMQFSGYEKNDLFFLVYAIPAIILMIVGFSIGLLPLVFISIGITLYGFTYFAIHDIIIHQRLNIPFLRNNHSAYIKAILAAHLAHHRPKNEVDFNNFGLLIFPLHFFK
jgi:beta-carotene 3-hydroxylase